jgi:glycosyltransferase involved in cell wall biosynthesis
MAGTGNVCYYNALELARRGHQVSVYTAAGPLPNKFDPPGVTVHRLPAVLRFGNAPLLPGLMRIRDVDIIHLHYPFIFGAEIIWAVSKLRRIPFVITYHNDLIGQGLRRPLFDAYTLLTANAVLGAARKLGVVSIDHAKSCRMAGLFRRRWGDVVEIPNGVDTELFRPLPGDSIMRQKFGISTDDQVILFVGALDRAHYSKGLSILLEAFLSVDSWRR